MKWETLYDGPNGHVLCEHCMCVDGGTSGSAVTRFEDQEPSDMTYHIHTVYNLSSKKDDAQNRRVIEQVHYR